MADPEEGSGGPPPLMAEKRFLETAPPPYHRVWMTAPPFPPPPVEVSISGSVVLIVKVSDTVPDSFDTLNIARKCF